jgi:phage FluMu gp28-like protein
MVVRLGIQPRGDGTNKASLLFPNGSRIVALPGTEKTVRGFSKVSLLMIDEAARVEDRLYRALTPMLSVGDGDLWLMSTPWGKRGFFYDEWVNGKDWVKVQVRATECPRISAKFLEKQRKRLGPMWFEQEYMCGFVDNGVGLFERRVVEEAMDEGTQPLELPSRWRRP